MDKDVKKPVVYLDLGDMKQKERFAQFVLPRSVNERSSLEEQYASWLDLIDR